MKREHASSRLDLSRRSPKITGTPVPGNFRINFLHLIILIGGASVLAWFTGGFFDETQICTHCGAIRQEHRVLWMPFRKTQQTPLSIYLNSLPGSTPESHQWMFVGGHGGPIRCALGSGRELLRPIKSPEVVESLKAIRKHRGDAVAGEWTDRILDPKSTTDAWMALLMLSDLQGDFDTEYTDAVEEFESSQNSHVP